MACLLRSNIKYQILVGVNKEWQNIDLMKLTPSVPACKLRNGSLHAGNKTHGTCQTPFQFSGSPHSLWDESGAVEHSSAKLLSLA